MVAAGAAEPLCEGGHRRGFNPHPLFDTGYYLARNESELQASPLTALEHYLESKNPVSPHPLFDREYYRELCGDRSVKEPLLVDYLESDEVAKRDPNPLFSRRYYLEQAPDVAAHGMIRWYTMRNPVGGKAGRCTACSTSAFTSKPSGGEGAGSAAALPDTGLRRRPADPPSAEAGPGDQAAAVEPRGRGPSRGSSDRPGGRA